MLILDATTKSLEIVLAGAVTANQLPVVASYVDVTTSTYTPGSSDNASNSTTPVTVVAAPAASTQRQVKLLTIQNADTVSATVTLRYNDNGTTRVIVKVALSANDTLVYTDGEGFRVIDTSGEIKTSALASTVADTGVLFTDNTTGNVSTAKHGYAPKADNVATHYLDGTGAYSTPPGSTPADAEYVTTAASSGLTAEVNIPGLAGSADIAGAGGAGTSEEYDTSTTGLSWNSAPTVVDSDTTIKSYLYVKIVNSNTEYIGTKSWAPGSGAFDARTKLIIGAETGAATGYDFSLHIGDSGNSNRLMLYFSYGGAQNFVIKAYTYASSTFTQRGSTWTVGTNVAYARIARDGSNNVSYYFSMDGITWALIATQSFTLTVANIGFRTQPGSNAITSYGASDWLRTSV